ncbi:hypothetical protein OUZ56_029816 [Daphnia magna]|uniref:Uncharacterized protein n=1 Tax=Daphnia magna TaxID=35525 RepID=A0ABR0B8C7_9CRUS|nr:hypothetical protein OUZ56_029816 [Daphnia magna]
MGAIILKKLQVAAWRDELIHIYEDVKDLYHKFATSSRHSVSSIGTSASDVTISTTFSQKRSTRSAPTDPPRQISQLDLHIQKQMLELEVRPSNQDWRQQGAPEEEVIDQRARIPSRPQTLSTRKHVSARSTLKSLEATVLHRRTLLDADTSSREQPSRQRPIMHPACGPSIWDDTSSDTSPEHQPPNGSSNPSHGGCCSRPRTPSFTIQPFDGNPKNYARFKAKFRSLYENEYNGSPDLLFLLEELLSKEVRKEIGE